MKKKYTLIVLVMLGYLSFAQNNENAPTEPIVKFSGFIRYDAYFDTYASTTYRDGAVYLYPKQQDLNAANQDLNNYNQFNMFAYDTRLRAKINGPNTLGAKVSGLVELDFEGRINGIENSPRIRHAFLNLAWDKTGLLIGQYWHPMFVTECFPEVIIAGAGAPFNPFNRSVQVFVKQSLTDKIELGGALLSHHDMFSAAGIEAQKNAAIPDIHGHLKYRNGNFIAGIVGGYRMVKPRTSIPSIDSITTKKLGSYDFEAFAKYQINALTLKIMGVYGQEMSPYIMLGGGGAAEDPTLNPDCSYGNINTLAVWTELIYKLGALEYGLFIGYTENTGSSTDNFYFAAAETFTRGGNIDNVYRISPRATYTSGRISFAAEYMLTSATYMQLQSDKYEAEITDDATVNHRFAISAAYNF